MSKAPKKKDYKQRAKNLRTLGILPKGYHLNRLGESEKRHIRRIEQSLKKSPAGENILSKPDAFISGELPNAKAASALSTQGYAVRKSGGRWRVLAQRQHARRLTYRDSDSALTRHYRNRRVVTYPLDGSLESHQRIADFFRRASTRAGKSYLTFRVGDKSPFNIAIGSIEEFNKYAKRFGAELDARRESHPTWADPRGEIQIVEVTKFADDDDGEEHDE